MNGFKQFVKTTLFGGLVVLLPVGILLVVFNWIFGMIKSMIEPLTRPLVSRQVVPETLAALMVLAAMVALCFVVGLIVRTQVGKFLHAYVEQRILTSAPGYGIVKQTVLQFVGNKPSPFASVALARVFGNDTLVTAFITEKHENGWYTIFVPLGLSPMSGHIYHLRAENVFPIDMRVEDVMRSIISCGTGSDMLMKEYLRKLAEENRPQDLPPVS